MDPLPLADEVVLVAVLPHPRDLDIARTLGWYRIPLRSAPKLVAADFLAFYQPASFGQRKWRVEVAAPVVGHELTTRRALLKNQVDHPRADEEYFKLQLGELIALPRPVLAGAWKRLTFLYTTGEYLMQARYLRDLILPPEERAYLWRALRERAARGYLEGSGPPELPAEVAPKDLLALLLGYPRAR